MTTKISIEQLRNRLMRERYEIQGRFYTENGLLELAKVLSADERIHPRTRTRMGRIVEGLIERESPGDILSYVDSIRLALFSVQSFEESRKNGHVRPINGGDLLFSRCALRIANYALGKNYSNNSVKPEELIELRMRFLKNGQVTLPESLLPDERSKDLSVYRIGLRVLRNFLQEADPERYYILGFNRLKRK